MPPTPAPTPLASNGKRAEPLVEEPSPTKKQKTTSAPTRSSPHNLSTRPAHTSSESSAENAVLPKNSKKTKKDRSLSVMTGSDVFGSTDVNTMFVDHDKMAQVSISPSGENAITNVTCLVHPASQMMRVFRFSDGTCGSRHMWPIPMPTDSVDYNVTLLRADAGCMTGHNSCLSSSSYKS